MNYIKYFLIMLTLFVQTVSAQSVDNPKITYFHNDITGTPIAASDEEGNIIWREERRAYGEIKVDPLKPKTLEEFSVGFTGHQADRESGLTYAKARYYNKEIGRFYAPDPIPFRQNDLVSFNRYAYAANNPYMFSDPTGKIVWFAVPIIAGAIIGGSTRVAQAPMYEGDIHTLSLQDRVGLAGVGATAGVAVSTTIATVGTKEIAQTAFEETTRIELSVPSVSKVTANIIKKSASERLKNLNGMSKSKAAHELKSIGFEYRGRTKGDYEKYYHSYGSRVQIRPDGEVVRTGPKIKSIDPNKKGYRPRVGADGKPTNSHNTGERIKEYD